HKSGQQTFASATNAEIVSLSEQLFSGDANRAVSSDITLNVQYKASSTQTSSGTDFASQKLFSYVNEAKLFARPTFSRLISLLDNYVKTTGTAESVTSGEITEQNAFVDEIFRTTVFSRLSSFLISKGYYTSTESFKTDFKEMWFGLYTRTKGPMDSSGFEHAFLGQQTFASATNAEIVSLSEQLFSGDANRAVSSDITLNVQYKASSTQTSSGTDFASQKLFSYVNEAKLFARPTFSRLISLLDNYVKTTGTAESVTSGEITEQNAFVDEIFRTTVFSRLSSFLISKGYYTSTESFKTDFKEMWFGLYTRTK
ncbi:uridylate-specific endoribonuclease D-like, partial [Hyla sarda]|uniref:uridylate-specific endoribonuclease D-like n=1 Tax=Hyla sarda TaxID=327740 RepID=UPI0024C36CCF